MGVACHHVSQRMSQSVTRCQSKAASIGFAIRREVPTLNGMGAVKVTAIICAVVVLCSLLYASHQRKLRQEEIDKEVSRREEEWLQQKRAFLEAEEALREKSERMAAVAEEPFKGTTVITDNRIIHQEYEPNPRHAFVTMMGSTSYVHSYWMGALAMIQSLREVQTRVPNIVVMARGLELVPPSAIAAFERLGVEIIPIEEFQRSKYIEIPGTWDAAFDKLTVWSLYQFDKVVFLDADTLIVQNIDHLFNHPELTAPYTPANCQCNVEFHTNPVYFTISSGFFVCEPSERRFNQILKLASGPSPDPADVEQFGGNWHWGDQEMLRVVFTQLAEESGASWHPLEWEYDLPAGLCSCPMRRTRPVYSYHFVCTYPVSKPWGSPFPELFTADREVDFCLIEIYMVWYRMFFKAMNMHTLTSLNEEDNNGGGETEDDLAIQAPTGGGNRVVW